jgi:hypothetical protein
VPDAAALKAWLNQQQTRLEEVHRWACSSSIHCDPSVPCAQREEKLSPVNDLRAVLEEWGASHA